MNTRDTRFCGRTANALRAAISGASDEYIAATLASAATYQDTDDPASREASQTLSIGLLGTYRDLVSALADHVATGTDPVAYLTKKAAAARNALHPELAEATDRARARLEAALG